MLTWIIELFFPSFETRTKKILNLFDRSMNHMEKINQQIEKANLKKEKELKEIVNKIKSNKQLCSKNAKVISNFKKLLAFDETDTLNEEKKEESNS